MKKIEVRPEKVRGMGNLIPPLSVSDFELSDCMIHEEDPFKINGHLFNHFSIEVPVVPVNLVLSTNVATIYPDVTTPNAAVITATLTDSSGAPVSHVDVYFQEEGVRIGTASTNAQGIATFEYSNSSGGTHTIRAYTAKQGKYNKSSAEINVNVYMPTSLSLSPVSTSVNTVDIVTLSSKIIDQNDLPLQGKLIDLYHEDVKIKSAYSDSKGIVEFPISVTDLGKTDPPAQTPVLVLEPVSDLIGETDDLITFNLDDSEHLNLGETVQLINTADDSVLDSCTVKSQDNTLTYTCTGKGDVGVKAKLARGTEVTYSNILSLEDCVFYDSCGTNRLDSDYTYSSEIQYSTFENNPCIEFKIKTRDNWRILCVNNILPTNCIIEYDAHISRDANSLIAHSGRVGADNTLTGTNVSVFYGTTPYTNWGWNCVFLGASPSEESWTHYKIVKTGVNYKVFVDGVEKGTTTKDGDYFSIRTISYQYSGTQSCFVKNVKVKSV